MALRRLSCAPRELAGDDTPSLAVAQHAVRWLIECEAWTPDILVLLQPTSPLRRARHLDEALERMAETGADTVVSVVEVPHCFSPYGISRLQEGWLEDFWKEPLPFDRFRRQNQPIFYARNGPAILATRSSMVLRTAEFLREQDCPYIMSPKKNPLISTPLRPSTGRMAHRAA